MAEENISQELRKYKRNKKLICWRNIAKWIDGKEVQNSLYDSKLYWTISCFSLTYEFYNKIKNLCNNYRN